MTEETIFAAALDKQIPAERSAFLDESCAEDTALRQRVEALIAAHEQAAGFLEQPALEQIAVGLSSTRGRTDAIQPDLKGITGARADAVLGATQAEPALHGEDEIPLDFLAPSDRPDALGRIGHYHVLAIIGRGGMGVVLKAFDEELQRVVAIKVMAPQLAATASARKRFRREAQAAAAVRDEHVIDIHAVQEINGLPYLVMEYISGISLQERLDQSGPLELKKILRIGMQTATGLSKAHAQGLIHRDIKPANILLENGVQRVKITDFGLARAVDDASLTQSGVITGTPQYMAPEQARAESVDHRADLFSLGSVLYAMCTGHPPFRATSTMAVLKRVCDDRPRPIQEINPEIPDWLCAIIDKLHAKDPAQRYQSATEVAEVLGQLLANLQKPALAPLPYRVKGRQRRIGSARLRAMAHTFRFRRYGWVFILALLALAGVVAKRPWFGSNLLSLLTYTAILEVQAVPDEEFDDLNVIFRGVTALRRGGAARIDAGSWAFVRPGLYEFFPEGSYKGPIPNDKYQMVVSPSTLLLSAGERYTVKLFMRRKPSDKSAPAQFKHEPATVLRPGPPIPDFALDPPFPGVPPFVVLRRGEANRGFTTLTEAVALAKGGDTIEIRGNGPFASRPVLLGAKPLTIRAGEGFRPIINLKPDERKRDGPLLETYAPLVLEGLTLQHLEPRQGRDGHPERQALILLWKASLHAANCRFLTRTPFVAIWSSDSSLCNLRNCEFGGTNLHAAVDWTSPPGGVLSLENCLLLAGPHGLVIHQKWTSTKVCSVRLRNNTLSANIALDYWLWSPIQDALARAKNQRDRPLQFELEANLFVTPGHILDFKQIDQPRPLPAKAAETALPRLVSWCERQNIYPDKPGQFLLLSSSGCGDVLPSPVSPDNVSTPAEWAHYWGAKNSDAVHGVLRFRGGDVISRAKSNPQQIQAADFRLDMNSAGKASRADSRDLGADVDMVGPGAAYERWKKTPEYQQWLKRP